jgi:hypothetical protein
MKSAIVLALSLLTLTAGATVVPSRSHFLAEVRGAHAAHHSGRVSLGPVGRAGEPGSTYTITLGADDAAGAIVFTRLGGAQPARGRYPIGESAALDSAGGFRVLYLAGSATRPAGVFRAHAGTVEITPGTAGRVGGRFTLSATGFVAEHPDDESREVSITGAFTGVRQVP